MNRPGQQDYVGRFAPSPTGPLHLGSMLAALASFLQAKSRGGRWLLRMEDLDLPRVQPGADSAIMRALENVGLYWDGEVLYQSRRNRAYESALHQLIAKDLVYACTCTRRDVSDSQPGIDGPVYRGTCRHSPPVLTQRHAQRVKVNDAVIGFSDGIQGPSRQALAKEPGDFVLKRSDGLFAYQLAVVVDDAEQGVTEVLRGADLLSSTARQIYLQTLLGYPQPTYLHVPLLVNQHGAKLSKQNHADPVSVERSEALLLCCLKLLGQAPPGALESATRDEILRWAISRWDAADVPGRLQLTLPAMS